MDLDYGTIERTMRVARGRYGNITATWDITTDDETIAREMAFVCGEYNLDVETLILDKVTGAVID